MRFFKEYSAIFAVLFLCVAGGYWASAHLHSSTFMIPATGTARIIQKRPPRAPATETAVRTKRG